MPAEPTSAAGMPPRAPLTGTRGSALCAKDPNAIPEAAKSNHATRGGNAIVTPPAGATSAPGERSPSPMDPSASAKPTAQHDAQQKLSVPRAGTPEKAAGAAATRQSFNEAARPNASVGRIKTSAINRAQLRAPPSAEFKVVLVGSSNAGKTCLAYRYVCGGYRQASSPTVGAAFNCVYETLDAAKLRGDKKNSQRPKRDVNATNSSSTSNANAAAANKPAKEEVTVKIGLWDTAGQEQFAELVPLYFRDAHAVILVVDASRRDGLADLQRWLSRVAISAPPHVMRYLAVAKCDIDENERWITFDEALEFAAAHSGAGGMANSSMISPGRSDAASSYYDDGAFGLNNGSFGRAPSIATTVSTFARRGGGAAAAIKVFEVSSKTGSGVTELFGAVAADAYKRHLAKTATEEAVLQAERRSGGPVSVAQAKKGAQGKRDKKCC